MTPEEFIIKHTIHGMKITFDDDLHSLLATVRDEARLGMLEDAMVKLNNTGTHWGHTACTFLSKEFTPPRTLGDVLGELTQASTNTFASGSPFVFAIKVAIAAVEGLKEADEGDEAREAVERTIVKLTEIK